MIIEPVPLAGSWNMAVDEYLFRSWPTTPRTVPPVLPLGAADGLPGLLPGRRPGSSTSTFAGPTASTSSGA
ncbi:MAG: hypothetical protein M0C28_33035 [Candidatus Moduliflexus flocculans]|nr:hypothetical protein [Candidatus Moduliflexus flocculans]